MEKDVGVQKKVKEQPLKLLQTANDGIYKTDKHSQIDYAWKGNMCMNIIH